MADKEDLEDEKRFDIFSFEDGVLTIATCRIPPKKDWDWARKR